MAAGVVTFWLALGIAIASVKSFTASNQLFQYPAFTITVGVIIAIMAVGMCGLFTLKLPNFVYSITPKHGSYAGSFGFGIMTAVLSTLCTAPLMGGGRRLGREASAGRYPRHLRRHRHRHGAALPDPLGQPQARGQTPSLRPGQ